MRRTVRGLAVAAGLLVLAPAAFAAEPDSGKSEAERRLEEVLAELDAQRLEIQALKSRLGAAPVEGGIEEAVKKYLESDEGKKVLGRGKDDFRVFWKEGLNLESGDKATKLKVGGRIMYDMIFPDADSDVETAVGAFMRTNRFRRARLELSGTIHKNLFYAFQVEFGATPHTFRDMFIGMSDLPVVSNLRVGLQKEPFSLEELTSSKYITFMERSIINQAFVHGHRAGVMVYDLDAADGRMTWEAGVFGDDDGRGTGTTGNNIVARVTGTPILEDKGATLLHLGLALQRRDPETYTDRIRSRPGISIGGRTVDSGALDVDTSNTMGVEAATVFGPLSFQGEYMKFSSDDRYAGGDYDADGFYLMASYFLTGESRPYKQGSFGRVKPKNNYGSEGGSGAWELAARYATLDLDDGAIAGGEMKSIDLGLNWYLNPNTRVMLNYTMADTDGLGDVNTIALRFQIDF